MVRRDDDARLAAIAARLDRLTPIPTGVLAKVVTEDGLCFWAFERGDVPAMAGREPADRELAAWLCAGCPVVVSVSRLACSCCGAAASAGRGLPLMRPVPVRG